MNPSAGRPIRLGKRPNFVRQTKNRSAENDFSFC